jgi:UMF1 family MFS transporter
VGTMRPACGFLAVLIALPVPLLYMVDVEKGRADAVALSEKGGDYGYQDVALDDYEGGDGDDGGHAPSQGLMRGWEDEELDDRRTR